eukprot:TRINITY_DN674_c2_g1_i3.p1 TRINITY_DN674_c2_g1~~TRINITY_DN674_c2_g1_i3.p1  ORF type:complete len:260 (-),score=35.68 TRINITY_DN674_c2_g1_i3:597-1376(-)
MQVIKILANSKLASLILIVFASGVTAQDRPSKPLIEAESVFSWRGKSDWQSPATERDRLVTDRPHICEATSTVGKGRIQLETGYSFFWNNSNGIRTQTHSFPEPLLRYGVIAEWFELRLATNYLVERQQIIGQPGSTQKGTDDMLIAAKVALFKQDGWLPDFTVFPQMRAPTGSSAFSSGEVLPGVNLAYSWAVTEVIEIECNTVFNEKNDGSTNYLETFQGINIEYDLGERWLLFTEYALFAPSGSVSAHSMRESSIF